MGLRNVIRPTTLIEAPRLCRELGLDVTLASETFQTTGSFKFRAAYNFALKSSASHIITASSGNFGQAMACACQMLGKQCTVVMPQTSAQVKIEAVRDYGATLDLIDVKRVSRQQRVDELCRQHPPATAASAYDDAWVIEGNATLGDELAAPSTRFDCVVAPIGGGGLTAGLITGLCRSGSTAEVIAVEPVLANDAARSLRAGRIVVNDAEPTTIADGVRTLSVGRHNWEILRTGLAGIVEVTETKIREAVRRLFSAANLKAEPTGALSIAALLEEPELFRDKRLCCVISGGNVDPQVYASLVTGS